MEVLSKMEYSLLTLKDLLLKESANFLIDTKEWVCHRKQILKELQSLPLNYKIMMTESLFLDAVKTFGVEHLYISFSGGKDSTVLSHIIRKYYPQILHLIVDTSCEYPETISFVEEMRKSGVRINTIIPTDRNGKMWTFERVVSEFGYPMFSKAVANGIRTYNHAKTEVTKQHSLEYMTRRFPNYLPYLSYPISDLCCEKLKKGPLKREAHNTGMKCSIIGTLAEESQTRERDWLHNGSNIFFVKADNQCRPLSFWTEQDIWDYIELFNIPIAELYNKGYERNGCMYCGFGVKSEKKRLGMNRFERLSFTHPQEYDYLISHYTDILDACKIEY